MIGLDEVLAALEGVRGTLPHLAAEEYQARMESVGQQISATLRTSRDEADVMSIIVKARDEGVDHVNRCLAQLDQTIVQAGSDW